MKLSRKSVMVSVLTVLCSLPAIAAAQPIRELPRTRLVQLRPFTLRTTTPAPEPRRAPMGTSTRRFVFTPPMRTAGHTVAPAEVRLTIDLLGSYSRLASGEVSIRRGGSVVAEGSSTQELVIPGGSPVDITVTATCLIDSPSVTVSGVSLPTNGGALTVPVTVDTGLLRAEASIDGRRISGVVRFYRINAAGVASDVSCGSIGANGNSREISAGRYLAVLVSGSERLTQIVDIAANSTRLVRLEG